MCSFLDLDFKSSGGFWMRVIAEIHLNDVIKSIFVQFINIYGIHIKCTVKLSTTFYDSLSTLHFTLCRHETLLYMDVSHG